MDPEKITPYWSQLKRILFRLIFAYLVLFIAPWPLDQIPLVAKYLRHLDVWHQVVPWVGQQVFQVEITVLQGGGDTKYHYVQVFCYLLLAVLIAALWTLVDGKRPNYVRLYNWLRIYVRFYLATVMLSYGANKVIKMQFPSPTLDRLLQPFGEASPMGLLWTFMGYSESYTIFGGAGEMLGGLLLTTRRTTLLGALICIGVMSNVVMLNFSYDVPVKLFSSHLLAMALFLTLPDLERLARLFLLHRSADPIYLPALFRRRWLNVTSIVLRTLLVVAYTGNLLYTQYEMHKYLVNWGPDVPVYGVWNVEEFVRDGHAPAGGDPTRWRLVIFDFPNLTIMLMSDARERYPFAVDTAKKTVSVIEREEPMAFTQFSYEQPEPDVLVLEGTLANQKIHAKLRRAEIPSFLLMDRGFHWINEHALNK